MHCEMINSAAPLAESVLYVYCYCSLNFLKVVGSLLEEGGNAETRHPLLHGEINPIKIYLLVCKSFFPRLWMSAWGL